MYLANRGYADYDDIMRACCDAWNSLVDVPNHVNKLCSRSWANYEIIFLNGIIWQKEIFGSGSSGAKKVMEPEAILGKSLWNESQLSLKPPGSKAGMFSVLYSKRLSTSIRRHCLLLFQRQ